VSDWDDADDFGSEEGFKLNFSGQEAASEAREFSVLPSGSYKVLVDDVELKQVGSGKNMGKPMANFTFKVTDDAFGGKYVGQKAFWLVMLFEGALYSAAQLMKSQGLDPNSQNFPALEWWMGKELVIIGGQKDAKEKSDKTDGEGKAIYVTKYEDVPDPSDPNKMIKKAVKRFEVSGAKSVAAWKGKTGTPGSKSSSLLPG
jgi:hypothetical protein